MRICKKMSIRRFTLTGSAILCILTASNGAVAQTPQPQGSPTEKPAPALSTRGWVVSCSGGKGGLDCATHQSIYRGDKKMAAAYVVVPAATKTPTMQILVPVRSYLPAGVSIRFGQNEAKRLPVKMCGPNGCLAEYAITEADIGAMLKGADLTISYQNEDQTPASYVVLAAGFPEAYARVK